MRIVSVVGARPQFVKAAVVSRSLAGVPGVVEILVHTGQHYDHNLSRVFFDELGMPSPHVNLGVGSGPHGQQTGRMLEALERLLLKEQPDWVLVYGDTNSTLAGALAAAKLGLPVAHVEAGLRSFNRRMPEETNRVLTDHVSLLLFAPTRKACENLRREGIDDGRVCLSGDVMYDAALYYGEMADDRSRILETVGLQTGQYVLATIHRAENTDDPDRLEAIVVGLGRVASRHTVVLPLHPRTKKYVEGNAALTRSLRKLRIIEPVSYLDMLKLERHACLIITDSGGVQKEAFFHGVRCVTLRGETEWVELVDSGWNTLVYPGDAAAVASGVLSVMATPLPLRREQHELYGNGQAAMRIVARLLAS